MPTAKAIPAREIILMLRPRTFRMMNTDKRLTGMLIATISRDRADPKNTSRTATASTAPKARFDLTRRIASSM